MNRESFYNEKGRKVYHKEYDGYFYIQTIKDIITSELFMDELLEVFDYQDLQDLKNDNTEVYVLDKDLPSTWSGILLNYPRTLVTSVKR